MINYCKQNCINKTQTLDCITATGRFKDCNHALNAVNADCKVISHRGHSHIAPENTLASVAASIAVGADACEFDVRCTADGEVVLMHDATVDRTTSGSGAISEMTLTEAQSLDAGAWKGAEYIGQPVPSLADVFELMAPSGQHAVVEIKDPAAAEGVVEVTRKYSMSNRITALSDDPETLCRIESIDPTIRRALLCTAFPNDIKNAGSQTDWLINRAHKPSANVVDIDYRFTSPQMISSLHRAGIEVWVWTVNAGEIMNCLLEWGIDGIASDQPNVLLGTVKNVL